MTTTQHQHQPGDHVLVPAEVLEVTGQGRLLVCFGADVIGRKEAHRCVDPADVRPVPVAPAPDTGGQDRAVYNLIGERDRLHDVADGLASLLAPPSVLGEHSSMNDPWQNAVAYAEDHPASWEREEAARTAPAPVDDGRVERAAVALAEVHDGGACFDPLVVEDGYVSDSARDEYDSGAEDREWFRQGARAVLAVDDAHRAGEGA